MLNSGCPSRTGSKWEMCEKRPLHLSSEQITFEAAVPLHGTAEVFFRLLPTPRVVIEAHLSERLELLRGPLGGGPTEITFPSRGISAEVIVTSLGASDRPVTMIPSLEPLITGPMGDPVLVEFQILNFMDFLLVDDRRENRALTIYADQWQIDIEVSESAREVFAELKLSGGYGFTHSGKLQRNNNESFSVESANEVLQALYYFLSFARGFWSSPALSVGTDSNGLRVWEEWGSRHTISWRNVDSWFDPHNAELLSQVFPGFLRLWRDPVWRDPVQRALYWYIGSNIAAGGVDGALILTQAALELLAWVLLVEDRKMLSRDAFKRIPAADQIRLLVSSLRIPLAIPAELTELHSYSREIGGTDGPAILTELRNGLVHPGDRKRTASASSLVLYEAWSLGQWYIELGVLSLSGHNGKYGNRLRRRKWAGDVAVVPWAT